jgi:regulator of sigma E protease
VVPGFTNIVAPISGLPLSSLGIACEVRPIVTAIRPNTPATTADIQSGDEIVSLKFIAPASQKDSEGEELPSADQIPFGKKFSWPEFMLEGMLFLPPETKIQFQIKRGDKTHLVELPSTELRDEDGNLVYSTHRGLSFAPIYEFHQAASLSDAVRLGKQETIDSLLLVYRFLRKIGQGQVPLTGVGGPVEIARQAGQAAQHGVGDLLVFLTMLSANLAVLNFLPIPLLDGGHMVFLIYEGIRRKPASERVIIAFTYAGLVFLLSLMLFVLALDLGLISRR